MIIRNDINSWITKIERIEWNECVYYKAKSILKILIVDTNK